MKRLTIISALLGFIYLGCKGKGSEQASEKIDSTTFFETTVIFKKDINEVDSTAFYIYKIDIVDGKKDSTTINKTDFNKLAEKFLKPNITSDDLKPQYKESIFEDQTTGGFTINYSATNKELEVQSVDILLKEDGKTVKNIFIRKFYNYPDSSAIEQLAWKPGQRFQIIRSVQKKDSTENNYQTLVVWNENAKD